MRLLITGSNGFLARHVISEARATHLFHRIIFTSRYFPKKDFVLRETESFFSCELSDWFQVADMMSKAKPDVVIHLGSSALAKEDLYNPYGITYSNVLGTHHLLHNCPKDARFVLASSSTVYGPMTYDMPPFQEDDKFNPTSIYAATKVAQECYLKAATATGKVNGVALRFGACVGPGAGHGLLPDVVRKLCEQGNIIELLGDEPGSTKPFIHVSDAARALVAAALQTKLAGAANVTVGGSLSVKQVAEAAMDSLRIQKEIRWLGEAANWKGDNRNVFMDGGSFPLLTGWEPYYRTGETAVFAAAYQIHQEML